MYDEGFADAVTGYRAALRKGRAIETWPEDDLTVFDVNAEALDAYLEENGQDYEQIDVDNRYGYR